MMFRDINLSTDNENCLCAEVHVRNCKLDKRRKMLMIRIEFRLIQIDMNPQTNRLFALCMNLTKNMKTGYLSQFNIIRVVYFNLWRVFY